MLITGSTLGLGREVARQLAERGATVFVSAREAATAQQAAGELASAGDVRALLVDFDVDARAGRTRVDRRVQPR